MMYDIMVKGFRLKSAKMVVAHLLAREENVPLHQALAMLGDLPRPLFRNIGSDEVRVRLEQYRKLGVEMDPVESSQKNAEAPVEKRELPPSFHAPPAQPPPAVRTQPAGVPHPAGGHGGGVPLKDFVTGNERPPGHRRPDRRALWSWVACAALIVVVAAAIAAISRSRREYTAYITAADPGSGGTAASGTATVTVEARAQAMAYDDSARACGSDAEAAIRFYRLAIAFNRHNIHAWYGLLDALRATGKTGDAEKARQDMEKLFGNAVFSVEKILRSFGTPLEYRIENGGALYVEYRTKSDNVREKLLREAYLIARELKNSGACQTLSLFVSTRASNGLVVHCRCDAASGSPAEFEAGATVYFFGKHGDSKTNK